MELSKAIELVGFDHIDYCDTDSLFFERKYLDKVSSILGDQYGQFKIEKNMQEFQAFETQMNEIAEKADRNQVSATQAIKQLRDLMEQATNEPTPNPPANIDPTPNPLPEPKKYKGYAGRKRG